MGGAFLIGAPEALAIDGQLPWRDIDVSLLAEGCHEAGKGSVEGDGIERPQNSGEGIVAGRSVAQRHELPKKLQSRLSEDSHLGAILGAAKHRGKGDEQNVEKFVTGVEVTRIGYIGECFHENHRGLRINGKPLRIHHRFQCKSPRSTHMRFPCP